MKIGLWQGVCIALAIGWSGGARAIVPDHPVITEIYQAPLGTGGPVGRNAVDPHQEFIEIYLPPSAGLAPGLDKDALNIAFYSIEGDSSSLELAQVNYRIDLPTFDLDPSNGLTGLARPSSGVVVLGWVEFLGNPPIGLFGAPDSRLALINGGITSTTDFTFIAINGAMYSGTTNFPVPTAISHIDPTTHPSLGLIEQGSNAFLLVNRDDPGYIELCGITEPLACDSFPNLPAGTVLAASSLLDGFASNDDNNFEIDRQPYAAPSGDNIDLEFVLPLGGAFSPLIPQVPETGDGYQRRFVDSVKTTEDGIPGNENPALDAANAYLTTSNLGPFFPTPGYAALTSSPALISVAVTGMQTSRILKDTHARPALVAANLGGNFGGEIMSTPGITPSPSAMLVAQGHYDFPALGQSMIAPYLSADTFPTTPLGHVELVMIGIEANTAAPGDPAIANPFSDTCMAILTIDPLMGQNALGLPFQATAFFAVQGIPPDAAVANEFLNTSLGPIMASGLGSTFFDSRGHGAALTDPLTDLSDPAVVDPMIATIPTDPLFFINPLGTGASLVNRVLGSAEVASGTTTYSGSFNTAQTLIKAREFVMGSVPTTGGFTPSDRVHYSDAKGATGKMASGLTDVLTNRDFEIALIDTQLSPTGFLESGATDDFGIAVRAAQTAVGATVVPGEIIFLSTMGGLEGADIDSLDVPPHGNLLSIIYVDLDLLNTLMGVETIDRVYVIDGSGNGEVDILDVIQLPEPGFGASLASGTLGLVFFARRRSRTLRAHSI